MHFAWDAEVPGWMRRCMAVVGEGGGCGWQRNLIVPSGGPCQGDIALQFPFLNFIQLSTSWLWGSLTMTSVGSEDESLWCWTRLSGWSWSETGKSGERLLLVWEGSRVHPRAVLPQCRTCHCSDQWCGGTSPSHRGTPLPMWYICLLSSGNKAPARSILSSQSSCSCWMITLKTCEFLKDFSKPCFPGISSISWCEFSAPMIA